MTYWPSPVLLKQVLQQDWPFYNILTVCCRPVCPTSNLCRGRGLHITCTCHKVIKQRSYQNSQISCISDLCGCFFYIYDGCITALEWVLCEKYQTLDCQHDCQAWYQFYVNYQAGYSVLRNSNSCICTGILQTCIVIVRTMSICIVPVTIWYIRI